MILNDIKKEDFWTNDIKKDKQNKIIYGFIYTICRFNIS